MEKTLDQFYINRVNKENKTTYVNKCKQCISSNNKKNRKKIPKKEKENLKCEYCDSLGYRNGLSNKILCAKHAFQFKRHGKVFENTRFEQNDYIVSDSGQYAIINLRDKNSNKIGETIVDVEDLEKIIKYRIHMKTSHKNKENPLYYAIAKANGKNVRVHNIVMGNQNVDHINNNGLDNRKENLRNVDYSKNGMNQRVQARSKSGVTGVVWNKANQTWHSNIKKNNKQIRLSCCQNTFDNAVKIRLKGEAEYFKEYSHNYNFDTNTIQLWYISKDDNKKTFIEVDMNGNILDFKKLI